jgi:membrane protein required for beta-lactamase induction
VITIRPSTLKKKYNVRVLAEGYVYFDLFNQNVGGNPVRLVSPTIKAVQEQSLCFTFWFAVFGAGESAQLRVVRQDNSSSDNGEPAPQEKAKLELSLQLYYIIIIIMVIIIIILYAPCQHPFN